MTGAEFVAKDLGMKVETTALEQLGVARKLTVANTSTTLIADQVHAGAATADSTAAPRGCDMPRPPLPEVAVCLAGWPLWVR